MKRSWNFMEDILPIIGIATMIASYMPQLYLTYTTRNVAGQSFEFWVLLTVSLSTMIVQQYQAVKKGVSKFGLVFACVNVFLALSMLVAVILFR